ncbi:MAG: hypothetical protein NTY05_08130, partial [Rhodocyclales bacterium]|nr:hypothetical protein [Rhodocyclales bacterium]
MLNTIDYALLATRVYDASANNKTGIPVGWNELIWQRDYNQSGFSAGAYRKGSALVISYTGTNQTADWLNGNTAALGGLLPAPQIFEAMRFYLDVKAANPDATSFSFTGHSLGGGLAALMGVFFDKQAVVFDEAPFLYSAANSIVVAGLEASLLLNGYTDLDFALYNASFGTLLPFRIGDVSHTYLEGEVLNYLRMAVPAIAGTTTQISMGSSTLGMMDRHAMTLLTAMLGNDTFATAVRKLPNLATYLMDPTQFGVTDRRTPGKADLLSTLLRRQYGVEGVASDGRLDRFADDMKKLVGATGIAQTNVSVRDAVMMASMEYFYAKASSSNATQLFTETNGALHFKYSDIGASSYISLPKLVSSIEALLTPKEVVPINGKLVQQDAWHIQSGSNAMNWTATGSDNDVALGGSRDDVLDAGAGNDIVISGPGADKLTGGKGADLLLGGSGLDTYKFVTGDGADRIVDEDGGWITRNGAKQQLSYGKRVEGQP